MSNPTDNRSTRLEIALSILATMEKEGELGSLVAVWASAERRASNLARAQEGITD